MGVVPVREIPIGFANNASKELEIFWRKSCEFQLNLPQIVPNPGAWHVTWAGPGNVRSGPILSQNLQ
jgi:hypothetical protein